MLWLNFNFCYFGKDIMKMYIKISKSVDFFVVIDDFFNTLFIISNWIMV